MKRQEIIDFVSQTNSRFDRIVDIKGWYSDCAATDLDYYSDRDGHSILFEGEDLCGSGRDCYSYSLSWDYFDCSEDQFAAKLIELQAAIEREKAEIETKKQADRMAIAKSLENRERAQLATLLEKYGHELP